MKKNRLNASSVSSAATMSNVSRAANAANVANAPSVLNAPNTLKVIVSLLTAVVLCLSLFALPQPALAAKKTSDASGQTGTYVFDERGLFTESEFSTLEAKGAELAEYYNMGVYFLTTGTMNGLKDPSSQQRTDYATSYYREHNLGLNPTDGKSYGDGIMFVIAVDSRDYVTIAYGQGSYSFSDKGIETMEEDVLDNIKDHKDNWYGAAETYYYDIGSQLAYYAQHGKPQEPLGLIDWLIRIALVLGIPGLITFFIIKGNRNAMLTAREQSEAGNYLDPSSVQVTRSNDHFVNTTLVATPKPKDNDSGGGGFSSSGGGKF